MLRSQSNSSRCFRGAGAQKVWGEAEGLVFFTLEQRRLREDLTAVYNDPTGRNSKDWARVFLKMHSDRIRDNRPKALGELRDRGHKWAKDSFLNKCMQTFSLEHSSGRRRTEKHRWTWRWTEWGMKLYFSKNEQKKPHPYVTLGGKHMCRNIISRSRLRALNFTPGQWEQSYYIH